MEFNSGFKGLIGMLNELILVRNIDMHAYSQRKTSCAVDPWCIKAERSLTLSKIHSVVGP